MDNDTAPVKRLRYSPESKHAPRPKVNHDAPKQQIHGTGVAQTEAGTLSLSRSSSSAATLVVSDSASEQQPAPKDCAQPSTNQGLRASAAPWTPAKLTIQDNAFVTSDGWQSGFGPSVFGNVNPFTATDSEAKAFGTVVHAGQVCI